LLDTSRALPSVWRSPPLLGLLLSGVALVLVLLDILFAGPVLAFGSRWLSLLLALPLLPVGGALLALRIRRMTVQRLAGAILGATVPLALLGFYLALGSLFFQPDAAPVWLGLGAGWLWLILVVLSVAGVILGSGLNVNETGLHHLYRRHLARCYLVVPDPDGRPRPNRDPRLSALGPPDSIAPYHLINATVNFPASDNLELRGRMADFFLLSKYACGSALTGYTATRLPIFWEVVSVVRSKRVMGAPGNRWIWFAPLSSESNL